MKKFSIDGFEVIVLDSETDFVYYSGCNVHRFRHVLHLLGACRVDVCLSSEKRNSFHVLRDIDARSVVKAMPKWLRMCSEAELRHAHGGAAVQVFSGFRA